MNDIENDGPETRSRKRRSSGGSALTDISNIGSNFLQQSISYVGKKFAKKRRTSGEDVPASDATLTTMSSNPVATATTTNLTVASSSSIASNMVPISTSDSNDNTDHIDEVLLRCDSDEQVRTTSQSSVESNRDRSFEDFELRYYGFVHPAQKRRLPLIVRGSDPLECLDVYDDMYGFFVENENKFVTQKYFSLQVEMSPRIRTVLVDWVIEIHFKYKMQPLTLWLIINLLDRFLARRFMPRNRLQLAAIVCLFIVCKFEEVYTPDVGDCIFLTDNAYSRLDVVSTEAMILDVVGYDLTVPTPYHFLIRFFRRMKAPDRFKSICNYIAERNLHECDILEISPRVYASAAVLAGLYTLHFNLENSLARVQDLWTANLIEESGGLTVAEILPCAEQMLKVMNVPLQPSTRRKVEAALKKYSCLANCNVAQLVYPMISSKQ